MTAAPTMRLSLNLSGVGRHAGAWRDEVSRPGDVADVEHSVRVARLAEEGRFDSVFVADSPVLGSDPTVPPLRFEPLTLLAAVVARTERIGVIATVSSSYNDAETVARRVLSIDRISGGRAALNVVASAGAGPARNFGLADRLGHDDRYALAEDFLTGLRRVWHELGAAGREPLIVQAGASEAGRALAGRHADVVYAGGVRAHDSLELAADVASRARRAGRTGPDPLVLPGVIPFVADTDLAALDLEAHLDALHAPPADAIERLGGILGADLSGVDPDGPLPLADLPDELDHAAGASLAALARRLSTELRLSVRQIAGRLHTGAFGNIQTRLVGSPDTVAETLARWFHEGVPGFNLLLPRQPADLEQFVAEVIPRLRRLGVHRTSYETTTLAGHLGLARQPLPERTPHA
jgi:alkanesulfonate monooxygenase SsuD/methylene tetrahydromethanopterin reductase-like flavin-dependent oxidoreductase (luciferase family)